MENKYSEKKCFPKLLIQKVYLVNRITRLRISILHCISLQWAIVDFNIRNGFFEAGVLNSNQFYEMNAPWPKAYRMSKKRPHSILKQTYFLHQYDFGITNQNTQNNGERR